MSGMNFGFSGNFEVTADKYLKGGEIHQNVKLTKAGPAILEGKDGTKYDVLEFEFTGEEGRTYVERMFAPTTDKDFERSDNKNGKPMPSNWENIMFRTGHILNTFNPKAVEAMQNKSFKSFMEFAQIVEKALSKVLGQKTTSLKLTLDNKKYPRLPFCVGINKEGEAFLASRFLGENLEFSPYELNQIETIKNAKPTQMSTAMPSMKEETESDLENIDLDDLGELL